MSSQNLNQAALIATAIASAMASIPAGSAPMTPGSAASILGALVQGAGPLLAPQYAGAIGLATLALSAIHVATESNTGITPEQLAALFAADDAALAADQAAHPKA